MSSGYLILTAYEILYKKAVESGTYNNNERGIYAIPAPGKQSPARGARKYRGIDREALEAMTFEEASEFSEFGFQPASASSALLAEIEERDGRDDAWVTSLSDIAEVWRLLGDQQSNYEVVFGKVFNDPTHAPSEYTFLGCDAAWFASDHFSCICDSMFFPRWHGTDPEGSLFRRYFDLLNSHGLFETDELAQEFLTYYLSFDWTERSDDFTSVQVYAVPPDTLRDS